MLSSTHRLRARFYILLLLIFGHPALLNASDTNSVPVITVDHVKQLLNKPDTVIIDVRKSRNWWRTSKKILGAVRENPAAVDEWEQKYSKDQTLIFY